MNPSLSSTTDQVSATRRNFLSTVSVASAALMASSVGVHTSAEEAPSRSPGDAVRIGLIGAGGRGSGAVIDSLSINENVILTAIADFDGEKLPTVAKGLERNAKEKINVASDKMFGGIDAYKRVLDDPSIDIVLLTTPPGFRPKHIVEAIDAGKHVFAEKPTCIDAAGYHMCLKAQKMAEEKKLSIVTGTQYRRQENIVEAMRRIHDGQIGKVVGATSRYCSSSIWFKNRREGMSDVEYQIHNWMHFIWLSGDQICEQAVHNIDVMNWLMESSPIDAFGNGGRFTRPDGSEMWDSMAIDYRYPGDRFISFKCWQIPGASSENGTTVYGTKGMAQIGAFNLPAKLTDLDGVEIWSMEGDIGKAYKQEHKDLVDSVRNNEPIVELKQTADSSLTAVMGRVAAYTGQTVSWDFMSKQSTLDLFLNPLELSGSRKSSIAIPGQTPLV